MGVLSRVFVIISAIFEVSCCSRGKFVRYNGYVLSGGGSLLNSKHRITACAIKCFQLANCLSFNYHRQNQECQLNADSPYTTPLAVQEASEWAIYHLQRDGDWELVFRAQAYNNLSPYDAWMGTLPLPTPVEDGCRFITAAFTCTTIYRSRVLDMWDSEGITKVQLEMYKDGNRVVRIRLDGAGSTKDSWLAKDRLITSSWSTMDRSRTFNYFSLRGHLSRTFYLNQEFHNTCPNDLGWMMVQDLNVPRHVCDYDNDHPGFPAFLYTPGEDIIAWEHQNFGRADVLAVYIRR
ncbi:uncharacterized protein [Argopecten irradians]|uniref:uncharacterized protein n=1 Tax=Argopecten irradians TaxID=31199 RepID=UPI00371CE5AF